MSDDRLHAAIEGLRDRTSGEPPALPAGPSGFPRSLAIVAVVAAGALTFAMWPGGGSTRSVAPAASTTDSPAPTSESPDDARATGTDPEPAAKPVDTGAAPTLPVGTLAPPADEPTTSAHQPSPPAPSTTLPATTSTVADDPCAASPQRLVLGIMSYLRVACETDTRLYIWDSGGGYLVQRWTDGQWVTLYDNSYYVFNLAECQALVAPAPWIASRIDPYLCPNPQTPRGACSNASVLLDLPTIDVGQISCIGDIASMYLMGHPTVTLLRLVDGTWVVDNDIPCDELPPEFAVGTGRCEEALVDETPPTDVG